MENHEGQDPIAVAEILSKHGINQSTYFSWQLKYSGTTVAELQSTEECQVQNTSFKNILSQKVQIQSHGRISPVGWIARHCQAASKH
jgi:hypothetical protein